jgi:transposase-like protein
MTKARRIFKAEFKTQAISLAEELGSASAAGRELGINESSIRAWTQKRNSEKTLQASHPDTSST